MAERYSVEGSAPVGASKSVLLVLHTVASPVTRPSLYDVTVGCAATAADEATKFTLNRTTTAGTATAFTPHNLDPDSGVAAEFASKHGNGSAFGAEPTYTSGAVLLKIPLNQRNTFRWVTDESTGFILPATQNNGIGLLSVTATGTAVHDGHCLVRQ